MWLLKNVVLDLSSLGLEGDCYSFLDVCDLEYCITLVLYLLDEIFGQDLGIDSS
ncbi:hypothetical protein HanIR_Chr14g0726201 [Helianthus annuus]|nr:hypothetical protein HanIR_Chr14g0726201 [Helianthus annuus]